MSAPLIDFVVCARNNRELISSTLQAIQRQTVRELTCTLVDGRSTDGTVEQVRECFPWVEIIIKDHDDGPASSRNIGLARGSAPFVAFVDSDVALHPQWSAAQLELMNAHPEIGIACGKLLYARMPTILYAAHGEMNRYGIGWDGARGEAADTVREARCCLWANTSAILVRRQMLERIGGFDSAMFAGYDDGDLGWRANLFGYHVVFNPAAEASHRVHGTFHPERDSRLVVYLIWRGRWRAVLVNYEARNVLRYIAPCALMSLVDAVARGPRKEKFQAFSWNLLHLGDTLRKRRWVQANRTVRDRDLWPLFQPGIRGPGYQFLPRRHSAPAGKQTGIQPAD